jgi:FlaA1/EpsC-like NDP-sugar epimerase
MNGMELKNLDNPKGDIEIVYTGMRPGEKLYEELLIGDNVSKTSHKQILRAEEAFLPQEELLVYLNSISESVKDNDLESVKEVFKKIITGYVPQQRLDASTKPGSKN